MTNGRVTNAELYDKIDELHKDIHNYRIAQEKRIVYLETCMPIFEKKMDGIESDVDNLKKRDYIVGGLGGVAATIAAILGLNK